MKRIVSGLLVALGLVPCGMQAQEVRMENAVDSLSYMLGVTNSDGLKDYATQRMGVDAEHMADFVRGMEEGIGKNGKKELAYVAGFQIGQQLGGEMFARICEQLPAGDALDKDLFLKGFMAAFKDSALVSMADAKTYVETGIEALQAKAKEAEYADNKAAGERFLAENAMKEGVRVTESGLQYKILEQGTGEIPTKDSEVKVHYRGMLIDGKEFDSSYERLAPMSFKADRVIKGWTEALLMMPVGSRWMIYIPQELAYGARQAGDDIKPFSALIFEVELLEIVK